MAVMRTPIMLVIAALSALGVDAAPLAASEVLKLMHQRVERSVTVYKPTAAQPGPLPVVIALHGLGGTGDGIRRSLRLDAAAEREGFIAVYPDAVNEAWSYGRPVNQPMPTVGGETVDDIGFVRLLIDDLAGRKIADPARIYVTGSSRGGLMSFTIACALTDRIAAAAPLITGMTEPQREDCKPARPVPIMVLAGTADRFQSFDGARGQQGRLLSVPETMNFWRQLHGCGRPEGRPLPHRNADDPTRVILVEWSDCKSGARIRSYRVVGGGHQLPSTEGAGNPMSEERFGPRNRDIETADEIWSYFKDYRR
jgi:polyhydroxybutyrate depolymerase